VTDTDKPNIKELPDEVAFWKSYREICRTKEIDSVTLYGSVGGAKAKADITGAREDFTELCEAGCL